MVNPDDFGYLSRLLKERSGIALGSDKAYLVATRLKPILEKNGISDVAAMVRQMKAGRLPSLTDEVVDAMTTNESLFFRDRQPFEALVKMMLPNLMSARPPEKAIRIWCAAASTGQEPYSIAMLLEDNGARFGGRDITILATDLSQAAIRRARSGEYTQFEVGRGMPQDVLQRHFIRTRDNHYLISPKVRSRVSFRVKNLLEPFDSLGQFDVVFCRNVLIYFDRPTKTDVLERLARIIPHDGYLVLGGPETTLGLCERFKRHPEWRNVYVRAPDAPSSSSARIRAVA